MDAFNGHADMKNAELAGLLQSFMSNYDMSGTRGAALQGEVFADNPDAVLNMTKSMGA